MCIVVCGRELDSQDGFVLVVESYLGHVHKVVVQGIFLAIDHNVSPLQYLAPAAGLCRHFSVDSGRYVAVETTSRWGFFAQHLVCLSTIFLDESKDFIAGIFIDTNSIWVIRFGEVRDALKDTNQIEVVPCAQGLQLAQENAFLILAQCRTIDSAHCVVCTSDSVEIVLPFVEVTYVVASEVADLQEVDVLLHCDSTTTFERIV